MYKNPLLNNLITEDESIIVNKSNSESSIIIDNESSIQNNDSIDCIQNQQISSTNINFNINQDSSIQNQKYHKNIKNIPDLQINYLSELNSSNQKQKIEKSKPNIPKSTDKIMIDKHKNNQILIQKYNTNNSNANHNNRNATTDNMNMSKYSNSINKPYTTNYNKNQSLMGQSKQMNYEDFIITEKNESKSIWTKITEDLYLKSLQNSIKNNQDLIQFDYDTFTNKKYLCNLKEKYASNTSSNNEIIDEFIERSNTRSKLSNANMNLNLRMNNNFLNNNTVKKCNSCLKENLLKPNNKNINKSILSNDNMRKASRVDQFISPQSNYDLHCQKEISNSGNRSIKQFLTDQQKFEIIKKEKIDKMSKEKNEKSKVLFTEKPTVNQKSIALAYKKREADKSNDNIFIRLFKEKSKNNTNNGFDASKSPEGSDKKRVGKIDEFFYLRLMKDKDKEKLNSKYYTNTNINFTNNTNYNNISRSDNNKMSKSKIIGNETNENGSYLNGSNKVTKRRNNKIINLNTTKYLNSSSINVTNNSSGLIMKMRKINSNKVLFNINEKDLSNNSKLYTNTYINNTNTNSNGNTNSTINININHTMFNVENDKILLDKYLNKYEMFLSSYFNKGFNDEVFYNLENLFDHLYEMGFTKINFNKSKPIITNKNANKANSRKINISNTNISNKSTSKIKQFDKGNKYTKSSKALGIIQASTKGFKSNSKTKGLNGTKETSQNKYKNKEYELVIKIFNILSESKDNKQMINSNILILFTLIILGILKYFINNEPLNNLPSFIYKKLSSIYKMNESISFFYSHFKPTETTIKQINSTYQLLTKNYYTANEISKSKNDKLKKDIKEEIRSIYTFKPKINTNSTKILNSSVYAKRKEENEKDSNLYDLYNTRHNQYRQSLKNLKDKKDEEEYRKCSFKPNLSLTHKVNSNISPEKLNNLNVTERLYLSALKKKNKPNTNCIQNISNLNELNTLKNINSLSNLNELSNLNHINSDKLVESNDLDYGLKNLKSRSIKNKLNRLMFTNNPLENDIDVNKKVEIFKKKRDNEANIKKFYAYGWTNKITDKILEKNIKNKESNGMFKFDNESVSCKDLFDKFKESSQFSLSKGNTINIKSNNSFDIELEMNNEIKVLSIHKGDDILNKIDVFSIKNNIYHENKELILRAVMEDLKRKKDNSNKINGE